MTNMARLAATKLLARGLKCEVSRVSAVAVFPSWSPPTGARHRVHLFVPKNRLGEPPESNRAAIVGAAALALATGLSLDCVNSRPALCEAQEQKENANASSHAAPRSGYFDEDYEPCQLVGSGSFGMVMQCVSKHDGHVAAVKMIQDVNDMQEEVARESEALALVQYAGGHENIVRYDGRYEHDGFHYIVTEFVDGESLFSLIQKQRHLTIASALQLTAQLASALAFLRTHHLIHCDLKPANIMVQRTSAKGSSRSLQAKIIDFGSAEHYTDDSAAMVVKPARAMALSGTRCYWPPEVLEKQATSPAMDMWALGCILYIMIAGRHPFDLMGSSSEDEIVQRVTTDKVSFLLPVWKSVPSDVKMLIQSLLEKDPALRLSVDDVLAHPALRATT